MEEKENMEQVVNESVTNNVEVETKNSKHGKKDKKNKEVEKLQEENRSLNDKLLRVSAEMQNMRRRYEEDIAKMYRYDGENFVKSLLPILDNFERAISMDDNNLEDEVSKFLNGFKLIYNDLKKILEDKQICEIVCLNEVFDPDKMEAVMTEHVDGLDAGVVTCVMQKGYMYNDKVIRPAMVKVNE